MCEKRFSNLVVANWSKLFVSLLPMCFRVEPSSVVVLVVAVAVVAVVGVVAVIDGNGQMLGSCVAVSARESHHVSLRPSVERHFCRRMLQGLRPL